MNKDEKKSMVKETPVAKTEAAKTSAPESKTQAVAVVNQTHAVSKYEMPDDFQEDRLTSDDLTIPRVKLLQGLSPEVSAGYGQIGDWFNDLSGFSYGREITVVVMRIMKGWAIYGEKGSPDEGKLLSRVFDNPANAPFHPELMCEPALDENGKVIEGRWSNKVREDLLAWDNETDTPPKAGKFFSYLVLVNGEDFAYLTLKGKALKEAKRINSMLKMKLEGPKNEQYFENKYKFAAKYVDEGPQKKYWAPMITAAGKSEEDTKAVCYKFIQSLSGKNIKLYENGETAEGTASEDKPF